MNLNAQLNSPFRKGIVALLNVLSNIAAKVRLIFKGKV